MQKTGKVLNRNHSLEVEGHKQSYDQYKLCKVLPHIIEQFHYRVENRLLFQKIVNPRRDKIIMESVVHTSFKCPSKKKKKSRNHTSLNYRRKIIINKSCQLPTQPSFSTQSHHRQYSHTLQLNQMCQTNQQPFNITQQARFKPNIQPISKYIPTDISNLRQNAIGKIVKNLKNYDRIKQDSSQRMQVKTNPIANQNEEHSNPVENRASNVDSYFKKSTFKKLERRRYQHNKQNTLKVQDY